MLQWWCWKKHPKEQILVIQNKLHDGECMKNKSHDILITAVVIIVTGLCYFNFFNKF